MKTLNEYLPAARQAAGAIPRVLAERGLDPNITRYQLFRGRHGVWLFAVLNVPALDRLERYNSGQVTHHLSTALGGKPVVISNSNGLRYAVLLSDPPALPESVEYPGWKAGRLQVGVGLEGGLESSWDIGHILVAGMTGSGKSNFLRLLTHQALAEGYGLALVDPDGATFQDLRLSNLLVPPANSPEAAAQVVEAVWDELARRAESPEPAERLLVVMDEYNSLIGATGGVRGDLSRSIIRLAWQCRKYNITLVLSGQDWTKDIAGSVRDQMRARICFQVANAGISRLILGRSGAEKLRIPGRAWSEPWGYLQTYQLKNPDPVGDGLSEIERELARRLTEDYGGRMTYEALTALGIPQRQARRLRQEWASRGLAEIRPEADNALCLCPNRFDRPNAQTGLEMEERK